MSSGSALALLVASLAVGALVLVGVGGLVPESDVGFRRVRTVESDRSAPAELVSLADLDGVPVAAAFDAPAPSLPAVSSRTFREVDGTWRVAAEGAAATPSGRSSTMAVVATPDASTTVSVTLSVPRPGAGVVAAWTDAQHHLAWVVDPSGRNLALLRADGDEPDTLLRAPIAAPGRPLALALRVTEGRVEVIANGAVLGARPVQEQGTSGMAGMVAGPGSAGEEARFRDLTFA